MGGVIPHAELAANHLGDAGRGPQIGAKAPGEGAAHQQRRDALALTLRELSRTAGDGPGVQAGRALLGDDIAPPNDGAMRTPDATGHVGDAVTLIEERHGPASARLQRGLTAMWSHTAVVRPRAAVRFLYWAQ